MSTYQVPTMAELQLDYTQAYKNDQFNYVLNQPPPEKWIKKHPMYGNKYLPIDKVEYLMTRIFQEWKTEIISFTNLFNSVCVHVRVHYKNPLTGDWWYQDGVGAHPLQLDSGSIASDLSKIKLGAVQMALPIAEVAAIKDATDKIGSLFGKDLNRKDTVQFEGFYMKEEEKPKSKQAEAQVNNNNNNDFFNTDDL